MADWGAVKAAMATQMGTAPGIRWTTSTDLFNVANLPAVFIFGVSDISPWSGGSGQDSGSSEARIATIDGALVCPRPGELKRAIPTVDELMEQLWVASYTGIKLGMGTIVHSCLLMNTKQGEISFGQGDTAPKFPGATLRWEVKVFEMIDRTA